MEVEFPPACIRPVLDDLSRIISAYKSPLRIAVAETAAGGLISASLLSIPGASRWYAGGTTLYTRESRLLWGGWTDENLQSYTGPTEEIVAGLAKHTRKELHATHCVSESGTAGPTAPGGKFINSVIGNVSLAVVSKDSKVTTRLASTGHGPNRNANMVAFACEALSLLCEVLQTELLNTEDKKDDESRL